jgi:hypothetical protein
MVRRIRGHHSAWLALVVGLASCQTEDGSRGTRSPTTDDGQPPVPRLGGRDLECLGPAAPLDTCTWAHSVDAIVWGTLRSVELAYDLLAEEGADGQWVWVDECSQGVPDPGLKLVVDVTQSLRGDLSGALEVRAGSADLAMRNPTLEPTEDGEARWREIGLHPGSPLVAGQQVGLALHRVEYDHVAVWSLLREPMTGRDGSGQLRFGTGVGECWEQPPEGLEGRSVSTLAAEVAACLSMDAPASATERRTRQRGAEEPPYVAAGKCFTGGDLLPLVPPCESDTDCGEGGSCSNGICTSGS